MVAVMFVLAAAPGPLLTAIAESRADQADAALAALEDPEKRARLAADPALAEPLRSPRLVARLTEYRDRKRAEAEFRRLWLFRPQRMVLEQGEQFSSREAELQSGYPAQVRELINWAGAPESTPRGKSSSPWRREGLEMPIVILAIPLALIIGAAILRGGVSMMLAGIALVRTDGRRATRRQCALRAAIVWFPIALLLFSAAMLQIYAPERLYLAAGLWLVAVALLPVYVVIALHFPTQPPQDRITRTHLVPA
jgi:hypothetical protein